MISYNQLVDQTPDNSLFCCLFSNDIVQKERQRRFACQKSVIGELQKVKEIEIEQQYVNWMSTNENRTPSKLRFKQCHIDYKENIQNYPKSNCSKSNPRTKGQKISPSGACSIGKTNQNMGSNSKTKMSLTPKSKAGRNSTNGRPFQCVKNLFDDEDRPGSPNVYNYLGTEEDQLFQKVYNQSEKLHENTRMLTRYNSNRTLKVKPSHNQVFIPKDIFHGENQQSDQVLEYHKYPSNPTLDSSGQNRQRSIGVNHCLMKEQGSKPGKYEHLESKVLQRYVPNISNNKNKLIGLPLLPGHKLQGQVLSSFYKEQDRVKTSKAVGQINGRKDLQSFQDQVGQHMVRTAKRQVVDMDQHIRAFREDARTVNSVWGSYINNEVRVDESTIVMDFFNPSENVLTRLEIDRKFNYFSQYIESHQHSHR